jgi:hypothetical protein
MTFTPMGLKTIGGFGQYHLLSKKIETFSGKLELICWRITLYPIPPYLKRVLLSIKISWCIGGVRTLSPTRLCHNRGNARFVMLLNLGLMKIRLVPASNRINVLRDPETSSGWQKNELWHSLNGERKGMGGDIS